MFRLPLALFVCFCLFSDAFYVLLYSGYLFFVSLKKPSAKSKEQNYTK